jgi:tetratricopeptide (TPR) repeat protein
MKNYWIITLTLVFFTLSNAGCGKKVTSEDYIAEADTLRVQGKLSDAVKKLGEIKEKFPQDTLNIIRSLTVTADIYAADLHDFKKAIECHQKIMETYPDHSLAAKSLIIIAVTYENELKDLEKARQAYESFLKKYPEHELVPGVKGALDLLGISDEELEKRILEKNQKTVSE